MIQKHYKRYITSHLFQKVLDLERNYISIKWTDMKTNPRTVQIIGSFTNPPWEKKVDLDYCPLRGIYVKYMSNLTEGTYLIKYLVDSQFRCDPILPMATDSSGHLNNVLEIAYDNSEFGTLRDGAFGQSVASSIRKGIFVSRGSKSQLSRDNVGN